MEENFECEDRVENFCSEDCKHNQAGYCDLFDDCLGYENCIFERS